MYGELERERKRGRKMGSDGGRRGDARERDRVSVRMETEK